MKSKLDALLEKFPYFLNKRETSNFFKTQEVSNNQFKNIYSDLTQVYNSFHLNKRCLIWREQEAPYLYEINFSVSYFSPLKSVTCYKNGVLIYTETFQEEDEIYNFYYNYKGNTVNDVGGEEAPIIPTATFSILVEAYDENIIQKGYPENDEIKNDIFDHDRSLDRFGKLHNIPRREYLDVNPELYASTFPKYCNAKTEDDYYYMRRIIEYVLRYHVQPLPVLELWKTYHIDSTLENRQKLLLKTFDENAHDLDEWQPERWEHKDVFCDYSQVRGRYFFIQASTNFPTQKQRVDLKFLLVDSYGQDMSNDSYLFDIYLDNELLKSDHNSWTFQFQSYLLSTTDISVIHVDCKTSANEIISSAELELRTRGCTDANIFVSPDGSDSNDGTSMETPVKTIQTACNKVRGGMELIAILAGEYTISTAVDIIRSCTIMCCENVTIENTTDNRFFKINPGTELSIQDMHLEYNETTMVLSDEKYTNKNEEEPVYVIAVSLGLPPYEPLPIDIPDIVKNLEFSNGVISCDQVTAWTIEDLNGAIYDLTYADGVISYSVLDLGGGGLTPEVIAKLERGTTNLRYEDKTIKYEIIGDIDYD